MQHGKHTKHRKKGGLFKGDKHKRMNEIQNSPLPIRNDLHTILVPLERGIVLLNPNFKYGSFILHNLLALQRAGESVLEFSYLDIALALIFAFLCKLSLNDTFPFSGVAQFGAAHLQGADSTVVLDKIPECVS